MRLRRYCASDTFSLSFTHLLCFHPPSLDLFLCPPFDYIFGLILTEFFSVFFFRISFSFPPCLSRVALKHKFRRDIGVRL